MGVVYVRITSQLRTGLTVRVIVFNSKVRIIHCNYIGWKYLFHVNTILSLKRWPLGQIRSPVSGLRARIQGGQRVAWTSDVMLWGSWQDIKTWNQSSQRVAFRNFVRLSDRMRTNYVFNVEISLRCCGEALEWYKRQGRARWRVICVTTGSTVDLYIINWYNIIMITLL